jgi:RNA polymerase sigma-70 factor, ECF subfamily
MDRDLVERARAGDQEAFAELVHQTSDTLFGIARRILRDPELAEDVLQNALVTIWRKLPNLREVDRFEGWAYRILVNACYDMLRRSKRRPENPLPEDAALPSGRPEDRPLRLSIEQALSRLEQRERTAFVLCEIEGLSHREAGEVLDVNENTSRTLLFRAKRRLQKDLRTAGAFLPAETP